MAAQKLSRRKERVDTVKTRKPATVRASRRALPQTQVARQAPQTYRQLRERTLASQGPGASAALRASGL